MYAHVVSAAGIVMMIAITRLIAYAIDDRERWRRFLLLVFLALAVGAVWWLLADGGVLIVLHDFGAPSSAVPVK